MSLDDIHVAIERLSEDAEASSVKRASASVFRTELWVRINQSLQLRAKGFLFPNI